MKLVFKNRIIFSNHRSLNLLSSENPYVPMWGSFRFKALSNGSTRSLPIHCEESVASNHISKTFNRACIYDSSIAPFNDINMENDHYVPMSNLKNLNRKSRSLDGITDTDRA